MKMRDQRTILLNQVRVVLSTLLGLIALLNLIASVTSATGDPRWVNPNIGTVILFASLALLAAAGAMYSALSRARERRRPLTKHGSSGLLALTVLLILFDWLMSIAGDVQ